MKIGVILFERWHQRKNIGSSRIRGHWIMKYLNRIKGVEAESMIQGKKYDILIFQKTYWKEMARAFKGIKILDICDPDYLDGAEIVDIMNNMDAVTCSTENLKKDIEQMTKCPVYYIPDGEDLEILLPRKKHKGKAKKCVWFGYSNNMDVLDPTFMKIKNLGLTLKIVSDGHINTRDCPIEYVKWEAETADKEIQDADFALLPEKLNMRFQYKSPNKTIHAQALGLPVAKNPVDMEKFMNGVEREKESIKRYQEVRENNSVEKSAQMLYNIVKEIKK